MAFIAYHFHWSKEEIMSMPHGERRRWVQQISDINRTINTSLAEQSDAQERQRL